MAGLAGLAVAAMLLSNSSVTRSAAMAQLEQTLRANMQQVGMQDGAFQAGEEFQYYQNGVYTLVYNSSGALLAGQVPVSFSAEEPFDNGLTRLVDTGRGDYYVLDLWYAQGWEDGLWVRGILEVPESHQAMHSWLRLAVIVFPAFLLVAAVGGYLIAKRAFRPLDEITATAETIGEGADLSARIDMPPGHNEFTRLSAAFNQMFQRLERSFEAEQRFTSDASHELRTPLSVIQSACEYAQQFDETPEERAETLSIIRRQTARMTSLIQQLLNMTRLDQGTEHIEWEQVDLTGLVRTVCQEQGLPQGRLTVRAEEGLQVRGSTALLTRLLQNLLDNAVKYGREDGHVWVAAGRKGEEIVLSVRDDGIGIEPGQQEKIWQRFYQVDPARSSDRGAGLGLSMVQRIAALHGGYMRVQSTPGVGSEFALHLPRSKNEKKG